jgi:hypothetical protein
MVRVEDAPLVPGVAEDGVKVADAPVGRPLAVRVTGCVKVLPVEASAIV